ncbi:hypothetical protein [Priestia megaterium]|uniref:hypothetical protein n=1 Tax=Priestia megaterium TaxID=1404 RepID=UPI00188FC767|nr:hypothetical protein [Priestia megaterium]
MDFKHILKFVEENKKEYLAKELAENKKYKANATKRKASVQMVTVSGSQGR